MLEWMCCTKKLRPLRIHQDCMGIRKRPACALPTVCTTASTTVSTEEQGFARITPLSVLSQDLRLHVLQASQTKLCTIPLRPGTLSSTLSLAYSKCDPRAFLFYANASFTGSMSQRDNIASIPEKLFAAGKTGLGKCSQL